MADGQGAGVDVMAQFGLDGVLGELRKRKVRTTCAQYCADVPGNVIPVKTRCPAGSLLEVAQMPVNEDERKLEPFDERELRKALTLTESPERPKFPAWLHQETRWPDEDARRKSRRDKRKRKKRRKRRREGAAAAAAAAGAPGDHPDEPHLDEDERRLRKKRRKKRDEEQ